MMRSKRFWIIGLIVLAAGLASVAAIAATTGDDGVRRPQPGEPAVQTVDASIADNFGVFNEPRTDEDRIPQATAEQIATHIPFGANLDLSKRVAWNGDTTVYAVPGRDYICLVVPNADGATTGCLPPQLIADGTRIGPALIRSDASVALYAVVPDGVRSVTLGLESGKTIDVPVQNGGYYVEVPTSDEPKTISYDGPGGAVTQDVRVPTMPTGDSAG